MILADTSVWAEHLRRGNRTLQQLLREGQVWCHPFVIGELACGTMRNRGAILELLQKLPSAPVADHAEVLSLIESRRLMGRGLGWVDAHLLAGALLSATQLWTLDSPLREAAHALNLAAWP